MRRGFRHDSTDNDDKGVRRRTRSTVPWRLPRRKHEPWPVAPPTCARVGQMRSPLLRLSWASSLLIVFAGLVVLVLVDRPLGLGILAVAALGGCGQAWSFSTLPRRAWAKQGDSLAARQTVEFSADGVHTVTADSEVSSNWSAFTRLIERDELYLLGTKNRVFFRIVPRRAFESPADEETFRRIAEAHLPRA